MRITVPSHRNHIKFFLPRVVPLMTQQSCTRLYFLKVPPHQYQHAEDQASNTWAPNYSQTTAFTFPGQKSNKFKLKYNIVSKYKIYLINAFHIFIWAPSWGMVSISSRKLLKWILGQWFKPLIVLNIGQPFLQDTLDKQESCSVIITTHTAFPCASPGGLNKKVTHIK
jgi:hypothetical protein